MSNDDDLWGELPDPADIELPEDILNRQAAILSEKSKGVLVGEVRRAESSDRHGYSYDHSPSQDIEWALEIRVPRMDNYTYRLLIVIHDIIQLYPVYIRSTHIEENERCDSTEELKSALRTIFQNEQTQRVIRSLFAHAKDPRSRVREQRGQRQREDPSSIRAPASDDDIPF